MKAEVIHDYGQLLKGARGTMIFAVYEKDPTKIHSLMAHCPGCDEVVLLLIGPPDPSGRPNYQMEGNQISATLTPGFIHGGPKGCGWRGALTNGEWVPS